MTRPSTETQYSRCLGNNVTMGTVLVVIISRSEDEDHVEDQYGSKSLEIMGAGPTVRPKMAANH